MSQAGKTDEIIARKIASAKALPLVQKGSDETYLIEIWCKNFPPEAIDDYLKKKQATENITSIKISGVRSYDGKPDSPPIYCFEINKKDLEKIGIDLGDAWRTQGHMNLGLER